MKYTKFSYKMSMCINIISIYIYVYIYIYKNIQYFTFNQSSPFIWGENKKTFQTHHWIPKDLTELAVFSPVGNPKKKKKNVAPEDCERSNDTKPLAVWQLSVWVEPSIQIWWFISSVDKKNGNWWEFYNRIFPTDVNCLSALLSRRFVNHHEMFISRRLSHIPSQQGATIGRWLSLSQDGRC